MARVETTTTALQRDAPTRDRAPHHHAAHDTPSFHEHRAPFRSHPSHLLQGPAHWISPRCQPHTTPHQTGTYAWAFTAFRAPDLQDANPGRPSPRPLSCNRSPCGGRHRCGLRPCPRLHHPLSGSDHSSHSLDDHPQDRTRDCSRSHTFSHLYAPRIHRRHPRPSAQRLRCGPRRRRNRHNGMHGHRHPRAALPRRPTPRQPLLPTTPTPPSGPPPRPPRRCHPPLPLGPPPPTTLLRPMGQHYLRACRQHQMRLLQHRHPFHTHRDTPRRRRPTL